MQQMVSLVDFAMRPHNQELWLTKLTEWDVVVPSLPKQNHLYTSADKVINSLLDLRPEKVGFASFPRLGGGFFTCRNLSYWQSCHKEFGRGSKFLGIPPANLSTNGYSELLSKHPNGVFFGWAALSSRGIYNMVGSRGCIPYFNNAEKTIPWLLHDFKEDFYGEELNLVLVGYIRPEALWEKIHNDRRVADTSLDLPIYSKSRNHPFLSI